MRGSIKAKGKVNASVKSNIDITCEWQKIVEGFDAGFRQFLIYFCEFTSSFEELSHRVCFHRDRRLTRMLFK